MILVKSLGVHLAPWESLWNVLYGSVESMGVIRWGHGFCTFMVENSTHLIKRKMSQTVPMLIMLLFFVLFWTELEQRQGPSSLLLEFLLSDARSPELWSWKRPSVEIVSTKPTCGTDRRGHLSDTSRNKTAIVITET